jgi:hypothetical protein
MVYTFRQLVQQVLRHIDAVEDTTDETLAKDYINQAHQQRCAQYPWPWMLSPIQTFTTEADRHVYPLDHRYSRPLYVFNRTTNRNVVEVPRRNLRDGEYLWNTATGHARHFTQWERTAVKRQPSAASIVTIVSTSASDTGSDYTVVVKGLDADGNEQADSIEAAGTTPVAGTVSFVELIGVTKSGAWNGNLTLTTNSGAVTNLVLMPWEMGRSYPQIFIIENPTAGDVIEHRGYKDPEFLINDYDIPDIPGPLALILVYDALKMFATYNADAAGGELNVWDQHIQRLETSLLATLLEGNTLGAASEHIHPNRDDDDWFDYAV